MSAFRELLDLDADAKSARGLEFTPGEIAQQPSVWAKTAALLTTRRKEVLAFLRSAGLAGDGPESVLVTTGAGSSEFVGNAIENPLRRRLGREVVSVPTTHLVTHAARTLVPAHAYTLLSFARSGNSPESLAACDRARRAAPSLREIVVTCSAEGALGRAASQHDDTLCLVLPAETNDRGLAMTSSYSSMALAGLGLGLADEPEALTDLAERAGAAARRVLDDYGDLLHDFAALAFDRACFLGSNALYGTMQECHLKMQEMTEGRVACRFDSFLGLRHGPQVFVHDRCAVVAGLASDPSVRRYEMDMLRQLREREQGCGTLVVCDRADDAIRAVASHVVELFPEGDPIDDDYRVLTDVVVGQMLALFKSLDVGLKPDSPSATGTINRVVKGVVIYED
jgi:tagatose-6-phosphate ketose/aldose isomerase